MVVVGPGSLVNANWQAEEVFLPAVIVIALLLPAPLLTTDATMRPAVRAGAA